MQVPPQPDARHKAINIKPRQPKSASGRAARRDNASRAEFVDATPARHDFRSCSRRPLLRRAMSARSPPAPWLRADVSAKRFRGDADALSTRVLSCARGGGKTVSRRRGRALDAGTLARMCALPDIAVSAPARRARPDRSVRRATTPCGGHTTINWAGEYFSFVFILKQKHCSHLNCWTCPVTLRRPLPFEGTGPFSVS